MRYKAFIPYVNRPDLLERAYNSVKNAWQDNLFFIDNSLKSDLSDHYSAKKLITPPIPLTFTQTMNLCQKIAIEENLDFFITMHNDAVMGKDQAEQLLDFTQKTIESGKKWGLIFTFYDTVCVYNTKAIRTFEPWDTLFPQYYADNDYFRRMRLKGYPTLESEIHPVHDASQTWRSEGIRKFVHLKTIGFYANMYALKWGGNPGEETFARPYGQAEYPL